MRQENRNWGCETDDPMLGNEMRDPGVYHGSFHWLTTDAARVLRDRVMRDFEIRYLCYPA